jgi:peroxiredoxin
MRILASLAFVAVAGAVLAMPPVPRKAPEFTITEPSGKQTLLSSYKGKVVLLAFISTTCPHCQRASVVFTKLHKELGARGFQPIGIAFNPEANPGSVSAFIQQFGVSFPIGYSAPDPVLSYLGVSIMERWVYPEVAIIDRKGVIRAQSPAQGDAKLTDENYLRMFLDGLLKEGAVTSAKATTAKKTGP